MMGFARQLFLVAAFCAALLAPARPHAQQLTPHPIQLANGKSLTLNLPSNFTINIVAQG